MMATLPSSLRKTTPGNAYNHPSSPSLPGSWEFPAMTTERDPKESNREQAQALVSWIYFSFFVGVSGWFSQNTLQQRKTRIRSPRERCWHWHLHSHPCSCPLAFTTSIHHLDLLQPSFFLCVCVFGFFYFSLFFFFFLTISQAFSKGTATGSRLAGDYRRALGHRGWFPSSTSQLTWSRSFFQLVFFLLQK